MRSKNPLFSSSFLFAAPADTALEPLPQVAQHIPHIRGGHQHDNKALEHGDHLRCHLAGQAHADGGGAQHSEQEGAQQHAHRRIHGKGGHGNAVPAVPGGEAHDEALIYRQALDGPAQGKQAAADAHGGDRPAIDRQSGLLHGTGVAAHGPQGKAKGGFIQHPGYNDYAE